MSDFKTNKKLNLLPLPYIGMYDLDLIYQTSDVELLYQILSKVNEIAESQNIIIDNFEKVLDWAQNQIEIYTKEQLQEWLDNGTLKGLINNLLGIITIVDTTLEMLAQNNYTLGQVIQTNGYQSINDGGGGLFIVSENISGDFIQLSNDNYYFNFILNGSINILQYGISFQTDNTLQLQTLFNLCSQLKIIITGAPVTVKTSTLITVNDWCYFIGNNVIINNGNNETECDFTGCDYLVLKDITAQHQFTIFEYGTNYLITTSKREMYLENVSFLAETGEPINYTLSITNKRPSSYANNSGGVYSKYGVNIVNFSGYNALMIENYNVNDDGTIATNGASDNSAIGIVDRVQNVAAPCILVDTNRSILKKGTVENPTIEIATNGNISIGCNTSNTDANLPGVGFLKVYQNNPIMLIKDSFGTGQTFYLGIYENNFIFRDVNTTTNLISGNNTKGFDVSNFNIKTNNYSGISLGINGVQQNKLTTDSSGNLLTKFDIDIFPNSWFRILTGCNGSSANRPNTNRIIGDIYFDTTLGKPIWWNGTNWIDATGSNV